MDKGGGVGHTAVLRKRLRDPRASRYTTLVLLLTAGIMLPRVRVAGGLQAFSPPCVAAGRNRAMGRPALAMRCNEIK